MGTKAKPGRFDCYSKLGRHEPYFTLMARDSTAPLLIRMWITCRKLVLFGRLTKQDHAQLAEAEECAKSMERWYRKNRAKK